MPPEIPKVEVPARVRDHDWGLSVITSAVSIAATVAAMKTGLVEMETDQQRALLENQISLYARMDELDRRAAEMRAALFQKEAELMMLRLKLDARLENMESLFRTLEAMRTPAWVKQYYPEANSMEDLIRMRYVNSDYEHEFNVSRPLYFNKSDFEIYNEVRARQYRASDMEVLRNKGWMSFHEYNMKRGRPIDPDKTAQFWKFYVALSDGTELIVGMRVENPHGEADCTMPLGSELLVGPPEGGGG